MAQYREFFFDSTDGKTRLHAIECAPDSGSPRAVLQIAHGVSEHIRRYAQFAKFMADNGILVVGHSHLGHGESCTRQTEGFFAEKNGWDTVTKDIHRLYEMTKKDYPDIPYFLLGHSMGSFLARTYLIKYPGELSGCIISGTGFQPAAAVAAGRAVAKAAIKRHGQFSKSAALYKMCFGSYNKRIPDARTECDWLSRDDGVVDAYIADAKCGAVATVSLYSDMLGGIGFICKKSNAARMNRSTPVLFISGSEDPVGSYGKGVEKTYRLFKEAGCLDVSLKLYEGGRHEMLNETNKYQVYTDLLTWLNKRI